MPPPSDPLSQAVRAMVTAHHEAFLVTLLGADASTVPPERIEELMRLGVLTPEDVGRVHITVGEETLNPYEYMRLVSRAYARLEEDAAIAARGWGFDDWEPHVSAELERARAEEPPPMELPPARVRVPVPEAEDVEGMAEPASPDWMSPQEKASHREALLRAGSYARGLGNVYADDATVLVAETWAGESIEAEANADRRARMRATIQELASDAAATHRDPDRLARDLADATGFYSHNWRRIATTELQGAHNLGMVEAAVDAYGEDGRVVRITESGACEHCIRLLRDGESGNPRVFGVRELLENGTNVGRKPAQWLPTAWPIHPHCRCDTRIVPPGLTVDRSGRIRRKEAAA